MGWEYASCLAELTELFEQKHLEQNIGKRGLGLDLPGTVWRWAKLISWGVNSQVLLMIDRGREVRVRGSCAEA